MRAGIPLEGEERQAYVQRVEDVGLEIERLLITNKTGVSYLSPETLDALLGQAVTVAHGMGADPEEVIVSLASWYAAINRTLGTPTQGRV